MKPGCILFDLDGTLLDTAPDLGYALNSLRQEHALPALPPAHIRPVASAGARGLLKLGFGLEPDADGYEPLRLRLLEIYRANLARETRLFDGMHEVLEYLGARGLAWGIVTNKPAWLTEPLLEQIPLPVAPACIISGDSAAHPKPHPAPLFLASERCGREPADCVIVGDDERDIEAGRRAGMRSIAATYGYIQPGADPLRWGADALIASPLELLDWLARAA